MITRLITAAAVALFLGPAARLMAQEHPEHPRAQAPQGGTQFHQSKTEQAQQAAEKQVSNADISAGIKKHIASETKKSKDRKFHVTHESKDLALDLIKVHDDRLSSLGGGTYFACVDMKSTDGTVYDIDFFMAGKPGDMKVTETSVHKINGKPLYNWKQRNGVWKKVKV